MVANDYPLFMLLRLALIVHLWYRHSLMTHRMISNCDNASEIFIVFFNWVFLYTQTNNYLCNKDKQLCNTL